MTASLSCPWIVLFLLGVLTSGRAVPQDASPWTRTSLKAADGAPGDDFSFAVAMDAATALIGAPRRAESGKGSGAVYVFELGNGSWRPTGKLIAQGVGAGAWFGTALALVGNRAAVGAPELDGQLPAGGVAVVRPGQAPWSQTAPRLATGAVYLFQRQGQAWREEDRLVGSGAGFGSGFGWSIALADDRIAVGAPCEGDGGAVYVFKLDGGKWKEEAHLLPEGLSKARYGQAVALSGDLLAVGTLSGHRVDLYRRHASGWRKEASLSDPAPRPGTAFGISLSLHSGELLVGAPANDDGFPVPPAAYLFRRSAEGWRQTARLDLADAHNFGFARSVALGKAGAVVLGAREVYRFRSDATGWHLEQTLNLRADASGGAWTRSLAVGDGRILVGSDFWGGPEGPTNFAVLFSAPSAAGGDRR
jgi:hypothetical protein